MVACGGAVVARHSCTSDLRTVSAGGLPHRCIDADGLGGHDVGCSGAVGRDGNSEAVAAGEAAPRPSYRPSRSRGVTTAIAPGTMLGPEKDGGPSACKSAVTACRQAKTAPIRRFYHWRDLKIPLDNPFTASDHSCSAKRSEHVAKTL